MNIFSNTKSEETYRGEFYRDYYIDYNIYGDGGFSVQFCGSDFFCVSLRQAKEFIDEFIYAEKNCEP